MYSEHVPAFARVKRKHQGEWDTADPLYYHHLIAFRSIISRTDTSIHIQYSKNLSIHVPLKICKEIGDTTMWVHRKTFASIKKQAREQLVVPESFDMPRCFK